MLQGYTKIQIYSIKDFTGAIHRIFYKKKTCSRPLYIQISNLKLNGLSEGNLQK